MTCWGCCGCWCSGTRSTWRLSLDSPRRGRKSQVLRRRRRDNDRHAVARLRPRVARTLDWRGTRRNHLLGSRRALLLQLVLLLTRRRRRQRDALSGGPPKLLLLLLLLPRQLLLLPLWQPTHAKHRFRMLEMLFSALLRKLAVVRMHQMLLHQMLLRAGQHRAGTGP